MKKLLLFLSFLFFFSSAAVAQTQKSADVPKQKKEEVKEKNVNKQIAGQEKVYTDEELIELRNKGLVPPIGLYKWEDPNKQVSVPSGKEALREAEIIELKESEKVVTPK